MKIIHYILILCFLVSCASDRETTVMLDQAEALINEQPQQAYELLQCIDGGKISSESVNARYALLYTKAQYKNYIDTQNDSLINIAVRYYEEHGAKKELMEALLMSGVVQMNGKTYDEAMLSLKRAAELGVSLNEDFMLGQIYTNLYQLCKYVYDSDETLFAQKAYYHYKRAKREDYVIDAMTNLGIAYYRYKDFDKGEAYLDSALTLAYQTNDTFIIKKCIPSLAIIRNLQGNYAVSDSLYNHVCKNFGYQLFPGDLCYMAKNQLYLGNKERAIELLEYAKEYALNGADKFPYLLTASDIYKELGEDHHAWSLLREYLVNQDSVVMSHLEKTVLSVQRDYAEQKLETQQLRTSRKNILWLSSLLVLLILLASVIVYYRRRMVTQALEMENLMLQMADMKQLISGKDNTIDGLNKQILSVVGETEVMRNKIQNLFNQKYQQLDDLCVSYFSGQNSLFSKNAIYKKVKSIIEDFGKEDASFAELEAIVNASKGNILQLLKEEMPKLKDSDYRFFCYVFAGFSSRAISLLQQENIDTVYQHRSRWKKRIESSEAAHKELFLIYLQ